MGEGWSLCCTSLRVEGGGLSRHSIQDQRQNSNIMMATALAPSTFSLVSSRCHTSVLREWDLFVCWRAHGFVSTSGKIK